jgi:putative heme-binding domain-containing protein
LSDRDSTDVASVLHDALKQDSTASTVSPSGLVRALWLLKRFDRLDDKIIDNALAHRSSIVRQVAVQLTPDVSHTDRLLTDSDANVRFQAALSANTKRGRGSLSAPTTAADTFSDLLLRDRSDKWIRRAVLMAIGEDADLVLQTVWSEVSAQSSQTSLDRTLIQELADVAAAGLPSDRRNSFQAWLVSCNFKNSAVLMPSLISGLNSGWQRRPERMLSTQQLESIVQGWVVGINETKTSDESVIELLDFVATCKIALPSELKQLVTGSLRIISDSNSTVEQRIQSIEIASRAASVSDEGQHAFDSIVSVLESPVVSELQQAAVSGLGRLQNPATARVLCEHWSTITPNIRSQLINLLLSRRGYHDDLLAALENGVVQFSELNLDLEQRRTLLRWSSPEIGRRAEKLFGDEEYSNRKSIVAEWLAKLPETGEPDHGRKIYEQKCATCHVSDGKGHRVGPDMQSMSHRSVEDLLTHILDPNMSINPNYVSCVIETADGLIVNGLLKQESAESVTLMQAEAKQTTIARSDIESLRTLATSLMPEGLEKELTPRDLRSLISYLQANSDQQKRSSGNSAEQSNSRPPEQQ